MWPWYEFEKQPVEVQDLRRFTNPVGGIYKEYSFGLMEENTEHVNMCNRLVLETQLGSRPIMLPQKSPHTLSYIGHLPLTATNRALHR